MKFIKIMPDYNCSGLWAIMNDSFYEYLPLETEKILLPNSLKKKIIDWQDKYDKTLDKDSPQDSGFVNTIEEDEFEKQGLEIWKEMIELYPDIHVSYFSIKDYKHYKTVADYLANFPNQAGVFQNIA